MSPLSEMLQEDEQLQLQRYIKQHGMNRSRVRDALLSLVGEQNRIFTAEDLIALAKVRELSIGTTTIYSSIDLFVKAGILLPLPMGLSGSLVRTSLCRGKALTLCRHCGAAMLYRNGPTMSELQTVTPPRYSDVTPLLLYWGVCPKCYRLGRR